jgi:hypothetical protein
MKKLLLTSLFCWQLFFLSFSQDSLLANFSLSQYDNHIHLNWTMASGAFCNGIQIYRSTDSLNFKEIGEIPGICGDPGFPMEYEFIDSFPYLNQINYYRLNLGFLGYSTTKQVFFRFIEAGKVLIKNNVQGNYTRIEFNNPRSESFELKVFSLSGNLVYFDNNIGTDAVQINHISFNNGIYVFILQNAYKDLYTGKLIFAK